MIDTPLSIGRIRVRAADALILGALVLISLLAVLSNRRIEDWTTLVAKNILIIAIYLGFVSYSERRAKGFWRFFLRMIAIMLTLAYINLAVEKLQLIIYGRWMDSTVVGLENAVFGVQPTLWMQRIISKPLTEWMMFSYVIYLPLYPILCTIVYARRNESAAEDCLFGLALSNIICDLSFMLFPVAGPIAYMGSQYTVPLQGGIWTWFAEALRHHAQFVGGSIPSPHCANATMMWLLAHRYHRSLFWIMTPIVLSLYISTVYGRFHYATDAILGVAAGIFFFAVAPSCRRAWARMAARRDVRIRHQKDCS